MLKRIIKYIFLKWKWRGKLIFSFSSNIAIESSFEGMNKIMCDTSFRGKLGYGSYIGNNCYINGEIGRFCSIGPYVRCNEGIHPYTYPFVSTAPSFYSLNKNKVQNGSTFATQQCFNEYNYADETNKIAIVIGNDCWIGEGVFFVGGVHVSDGAVILAHAVVTKDIPPYAIVGGVPAKIIGFRYSQEDINFLEQIKWWKKSPSWFKEHWREMSDFNKIKAIFSQ